MRRLRSLWRGELPLSEAFWTWAITVGILVNLVTSGLFLAMVSLDRPWAALVLGYAVSVPYNALVTVGVWRSAGRYGGTPAIADLARVATLALMLVLSLT